MGRPRPLSRLHCRSIRRLVLEPGAEDGLPLNLSCAAHSVSLCPQSDLRISVGNLRHFGATVCTSTRIRHSRCRLCHQPPRMIGNLPVFLRGQHQGVVRI